MTQVIPFSAEYQDTVKDFLLGILEDEQGFVGLPRPDLNDILNTYMKHEGSMFWIAVDGKDLVGTIALMNKGQGRGYIKRLAVKKSYRKQGLGKALMDELIEYARSNEYVSIYAGTVAVNKGAIQFYKQIGFTQNQEAPEGIIEADDPICFEFKL